MTDSKQFIKEATYEQKQKFIVDSLFLLAHSQLQIELLDEIKAFKTIWKQTLKRKAITLIEELEPVLKELLEDSGDQAQEQAFFLINKVKELNYIAIREFNNTFNQKENEVPNNITTDNKSE